MSFGEKRKAGGGEHERVFLVCSDGVRNVNGRFCDGGDVGSRLREREKLLGSSSSEDDVSQSGLGDGVGVFGNLRNSNCIVDLRILSKESSNPGVFRQFRKYNFSATFESYVCPTCFFTMAQEALFFRIRPMRVVLSPCKRHAAHDMLICLCAQSHCGNVSLMVLNHV